MKLPATPACLLDYNPEIGLILGSGLGFFADRHIEVEGRLPYEAIEGFPVSTVAGHAGQFVYGKIGGRRVICMQGRFHLYEGYNIAELTLPVLLMAQIGVRSLCITNAAGGINPNFKPGDFMLIRDHINFLGTNPLIGLQGICGPRFPDMSNVYASGLRSKILKWAASQDIALEEGVYLATTGPSFETPAEIRAFAALGADAVGMSTVPEAIVACQQGLSVVGISCITNAAAGLSLNPLSHEEVSETANRVHLEFAKLLSGAISVID